MDKRITYLQQMGIYIEPEKFKSTLIDLLDKDEVFATKNAWLTAECTLAHIILNTDKSIYDNEILILGSGRCAKTMSLLLKRLGIKTTAAMRNKRDIESASLFFDDAFHINDLKQKIDDFDVVINTIPARVLFNNTIKNEQTLVLEVASIDQKLSGNYMLLPALPGKHCPYAAAKIMHEALLRRNTGEKT